MAAKEKEPIRKGTARGPTSGIIRIFESDSHLDNLGSHSGGSEKSTYNVYECPFVSRTLIKIDILMKNRNFFIIYMFLAN